MNREVQVRICERLGVKSPGPTRHSRRFVMSSECPLREQFPTCWPSVAGCAQLVIQGSKLEPRTMRYELNDYERSVIKPMLPNKSRGLPRVDVIADPSGARPTTRAGDS